MSDLESFPTYKSSLFFLSCFCSLCTGKIPVIPTGLSSGQHCFCVVPHHVLCWNKLHAGLVSSLQSLSSGTTVYVALDSVTF